MNYVLFWGLQDVKTFSSNLKEKMEEVSMRGVKAQEMYILEEIFH